MYLFSVDVTVNMTGIFKIHENKRTVQNNKVYKIINRDTEISMHTNML